MKYCTNCGAKLSDNSRFCGGCGTPVSAETRTGYDKREQSYAGKLIKCPNCGEVLAAFEIRCPSCGYELREAQASSVIREFAAKLEAIENTPEPIRKKIYKKKGSKYPSEDELSEKEKRKIDLIRSFPIPNTREDLYEFLILASSNIDTEHVEGWDITSDKLAISNAWRAKYEQAYQKAKISFGDSQEFKSLSSDFQERDSKHAHKKKTVSVRIAIISTIAIVGCILGWAFLIIDGTNTIKEVKAENQRLEIILEDVNEAIEDENYSKARALTSQLVFSVSSSIPDAETSRENWDKTRTQLYEVIDKAEEAAGTK